MTHPEELLAGYVDGSLSGSDRTTVDAHLQACARCRAEVQAAGAARAALRRLPDPEAPDLSAAVTTELQGVRPPVSTAPRWYRYAGIAAAAVIALAVVVSLPKVGSGPSADREAAGTSGAAPTVGQADTLAGLALELQATDYDTAAVQALAGEAARVAPAVRGGRRRQRRERAGRHARAGEASAGLRGEGVSGLPRDPHAPDLGDVRGHTRLPGGRPGGTGAGAAGRHRQRLGRRPRLVSAAELHHGAPLTRRALRSFGNMGALKPVEGQGHGRRS